MEVFKSNLSFVDMEMSNGVTARVALLDHQKSAVNVFDNTWFETWIYYAQNRLVKRTRLWEVNPATGEESICNTWEIIFSEYATLEDIDKERNDRFWEGMEEY